MTAQPPRRLRSLDIFRGVTIASMILVNNSGSPSYASLQHANWHGWTFTDTVFPFFLWIVGVAMTLSTAKRLERGDSKAGLLKHALRRAVILYAIGFLLFPLATWDWHAVRIPGVLQRIAVCYLIAFLIFLWTTWRGQLYWILGLNAVYWGFMMFYPTPGCGAGSLTMDCNFARYIDGLVLSGHMYHQTVYWDPEGIVSTLPAISTVLFGILAGHLLRRAATPLQRASWFLGGGVVLFAFAHLLAVWMPFNKKIWTTPYALLMAGLAAFWFGVWIWFADVKAWGRWLHPFEIYGANAIAAYVLSEALSIALDRIGAHEWIDKNVLLAVVSPINASLLYAIGNVVAIYLFAWLMYRRNWFVKF
jgi:predicted acyltransferase